MWNVYLIGIILLHLVTVKEVVVEFHSLDTKESEITFIEKYKLNEDPSIQAYVCAIEMKQAEYRKNPFSKLKIFNTNKDHLAALIESNPSNVHLRYVRLMLQESTPSILQYNDKINEDKTFLTKILSIEDETDYLDDYIYKNTSL